MPKLTGLFDTFDNLDAIPAEAIAVWLKPMPQLDKLENYLANRILYPQTLPQTEVDMQIDLAILREALKTTASLEQNPFLNITLRKLLIPVDFLNFVPSLASLTHAFIDAFLKDRKREDLFEDLWTIVLTDDIDEIAGSVILPQFAGKDGLMILKVLGKDYEIKQGSLMVIPCDKDRCEIAYKLHSGKVLGKIESNIEIYGGKLGVMIDGREV